MVGREHPAWHPPPLVLAAGARLRLLPWGKVCESLCFGNTLKERFPFWLAVRFLRMAELCPSPAPLPQPGPAKVPQHQLEIRGAKIPTGRVKDLLQIHLTPVLIPCRVHFFL